MTRWSAHVITLTHRAKKIISPVRPTDAEQAKLDAFLSVELFRKVFDDFDGHTLPAADGMSNLFLTQYKIVPNQVVPALRNLMDSAESAGLFKVTGSRSKLIRPIIRNDGVDAPPPPSTQVCFSSDPALISRTARSWKLHLYDVSPEVGRF
jgi:hypothetical protein